MKIRIFGKPTTEGGMIETRRSFFDTFNSEFESQLSRQPNYRKAYEATEQKFEEQIGVKHYSGWESFKNVRSRKMKDRRKVTVG